MQKFGILVLACGVFVAEPLASWAQSDTVGSASEASHRDELTRDLIMQRKRQIESSSLPDEEKAEILKIYADTAAQLELAAQLAKDADGWKKSQAEAPSELKKLKAELEQPKAAADDSIPTAAGISEFNRLPSATRQELSEAKSELEDLKKEPARRDERRTAATDIRESANERISKLDEALNAPAAPGISPESAEAARAFQQATRLAEKWRLELLDAEFPAYHTTTELLDLKQQLVSRDVASLEYKVETLIELLDQIRLADALTMKNDAADTMLKTPAGISDLHLSCSHWLEIRPYLGSSSNLVRGVFSEVLSSFKMWTDRL